jgi:hypothetical protein
MILFTHRPIAKTDTVHPLTEILKSEDSLAEKREAALAYWEKSGTHNIGEVLSSNSRGAIVIVDPSRTYATKIALTEKDAQDLSEAESLDQLFIGRNAAPIASAARSDITPLEKVPFYTMRYVPRSLTGILMDPSMAEAGEVALYDLFGMREQSEQINSTPIGRKGLDCNLLNTLTETGDGMLSPLAAKEGALHWLDYCDSNLAHLRKGESRVDRDVVQAERMLGDLRERFDRHYTLSSFSKKPTPERVIANAFDPNFENLRFDEVTKQIVVTDQKGKLTDIHMCMGVSAGLVAYNAKFKVETVNGGSEIDKERYTRISNNFFRTFRESPQDASIYVPSSANSELSGMMKLTDVFELDRIKDTFDLGWLIGFTRHLRITKPK